MRLLCRLALALPALQLWSAGACVATAPDGPRARLGVGAQPLCAQGAGAAPAPSRAPWRGLEADLRRSRVMMESRADASLAAVTTVLGAALERAGRPRLTPAQVLATDPSGTWARALREAQEAESGEAAAPGPALDVLARLCLQAFWQAGLKRVAVDMVQVPRPDLDAQAMLLGWLHRQQQDGADTFVIAHFRQLGRLPAPLAPGHVAPLAGLDGDRRQVLILEVDPAAPDHLWVSWGDFFDALATSEPATGEARGYLVVRLF